MEERAKIRPYALNLLQEWGAVLDEKDMIYSLECFPAYECLCTHPSIINIFRYVVTYLKSRDSAIKKTPALDNFIFAIRRRLPHNKPIHN